MAFAEEPQKSEVCLKDYKLNSLRKDKESRITSLEETEMTIICFRRAEGFYKGHYFLLFFGT